MNDYNRSIGAFGLVITYFFAVTVMVGQPVDYTYGGSSQNDRNELYLSMGPAGLFYHTSESGNGVYNQENALLFNFKIPFRELWTTGCVPEQLFKSTYYSYEQYACNLRIRYRKNDLIFPFHYYW